MIQIILLIKSLSAEKDCLDSFILQISNEVPTMLGNAFQVPKDTPEIKSCPQRAPSGGADRKRIKNQK